MTRVGTCVCLVLFSLLTTQVVATDRTDPTYIDFAFRVRESADRNSIAMLMLADAMRLGGRDGGAVRAIVDDHRARVSAVDSFRAGRSSINMGFGIDGSLASSSLVRRFAGAGVSFGGGFDLDIVTSRAELLPTTGRIQSQTGVDYVVGDETLQIEACGSIGGGINVPLAVGSAGGNVNGKGCYSYSPSSMTALAGYVAQNQRRLHSIETVGGETLSYVTDLLYEIANGCGQSSMQECRAASRLLQDLNDAGLGVGLPTTIRGVDEVEAVVRNDPRFAVVLQSNDEIRARVSSLEARLGLELDDLEAALLDPAVFESAVAAAIESYERRLVAVEQERRFRLFRNEYTALSSEDKERKLSLELGIIETEYREINGSIGASQNTLLLVSALAGRRAAHSDINRAFTAVRSVNEMVRSARTISEAFQASIMTGASVAAYANGVGAALALMSAFSSGGDSELEAVIAYLDRRLDRIDADLDTIIRQNLSLSDRVNALLAGQQAIAAQIADNARSIRATREEIAVVRGAISDLEAQISALSTAVGAGFETATRHREDLFIAALQGDQDEALAEFDSIIGFWLSPDSDVIRRLNEHDGTQEFLDEFNRERQAVLSLMSTLAGPRFVVDPEFAKLEQRIVVSMGLLPSLAADVRRLIQLSSEARSPAYDFTWSRLSAEREQQIRSEALELHLQSFPEIPPENFDGLHNPDALAYVLHRYLSFWLTLDPERREELGFRNDARFIRSLADPLLRSRDVAFSATFSLLSALEGALPSIVHGIESEFRGSRLFESRSRSSELFRWLFTPSVLRIPEPFIEPADADAFASGVVNRRPALEWLQRHSRPYIRGSRNVTGELELSLIERLLDPDRITNDPTSWRDPSFGDQVNLRTLATVRALVAAFDEGELFEYTDDELDFLERFSEKSALEISESDISRFVELVRSDRKLLTLAEEEGLVQYRLLQESEPVELPGSEGGVAAPYATVEYEDKKGSIVDIVTERVLGVQVDRDREVLDFFCRGAKLNLLDSWSGSITIPLGFAFPIDHGFSWHEFEVTTGSRWARAIGECAEAANSARLTVPHAVPDGFSGLDYYEIGRVSSESERPAFIRESSLVDDGTTLFHRATSRCALTAEWNPSLADIGLVSADSIGVSSRFVLHERDVARLYATPSQVTDANSRLLAPDGTELDEDYSIPCSVRGVGALLVSYHPGPARLGERMPPELFRYGWEQVPNRQLNLIGLRAGMIEALRHRRRMLNLESVAGIGEEFRLPVGLLNAVLRQMDANGVPRSSRQELILAYREFGRDAFLSHPVYLDFLDRNTDIADRIRDDFELMRLEQRLPALINAFARWGLGESLELVPEYRLVHELLHLPTDTGLTLYESFEILGDPTRYEEYVRAASTISVAYDRYLSASSEVGFPPRVDFPAPSLLRGPNTWIDSADASATARHYSVTPGHWSIVEIEALIDLMETDDF